jgi:uncharacterized protein YoxC
MVVNVAISLIAFMMIMIGIALAAMTPRLLKSLRSVDRAIDEVNRLMPKVDQILDRTEQELAMVQSVTARADQMAERAQALGTEVEAVSRGILSQVASLAQGLHHINAAITGARVAAQALSGRRQHGR